MLIDKLKSSPMYPTAEMGKQSKKNHWYVREKGSDQPQDQTWRAWWESRSLGKGHINWRSTCVAENVLIHSIRHLGLRLISKPLMGVSTTLNLLWLHTAQTSE